MGRKRFTGIVTKIELENVYTDERIPREKVGELETMRIENVHEINGEFVRDYVLFRKKPFCNSKGIVEGDNVTFIANVNENNIPDYLISIRHYNSNDIYLK